jgi:hypothetical protein
MTLYAHPRSVHTAYHLMNSRELWDTEWRLNGFAFLQRLVFWNVRINIATRAMLKLKFSDTYSQGAATELIIVFQVLMPRSSKNVHQDK